MPSTLRNPGEELSASSGGHLMRQTVATMARQATRSTTRRTTASRSRARPRARKKRFVLRWYHLVFGCLGSFVLGYLVAFGQATTYVAQVVGLR